MLGQRLIPQAGPGVCRWHPCLLHLGEDGGHGSPELLPTAPQPVLPLPPPSFASLAKGVSSMAETVQVALWVRLKPSRERKKQELIFCAAPFHWSSGNQPRSPGWEFNSALPLSTTSMLSRVRPGAPRRQRRAALIASAPELLAQPPQIHQTDVLPAWLPQSSSGKAASPTKGQPFAAAGSRQALIASGFR